MRAGSGVFKRSRKATIKFSAGCNMLQQQQQQQLIALIELHRPACGRFLLL